MRPPAAPHVLAALATLDRRIDRDLPALLPPDVGRLRGSHGRILDMIADTGSRPSTLAAGVWITKQAMGKRIRELEALGWVIVTSDPGDGRAMVVRRTAAGQRVRDAAMGAVEAMEDGWASAVGPERYATFRAVLDELGALGGPATPQPRRSTGIDERRSRDEAATTRS